MVYLRSKGNNSQSKNLSGGCPPDDVNEKKLIIRDPYERKKRHKIGKRYKHFSVLSTCVRNPDLFIRSIIGIVVLMVMIIFFVIHKHKGDALELFHNQNKPPSLRGHIESIWFSEKFQQDIEISVVILTYKSYSALSRLLPSVLKQHPSNFEIILVDNGCLNEVKMVVKKFLDTPESTVPYKYIPLCDNPGYAAGNNAGVKIASPTSKHILFLNDDVVLSEQDFIENMMKVAQTQKRSGAVGCKLLNSHGSELIEAGSIVFSNAGVACIGRGRQDINAPEFSYLKPVDYVSGACLMVHKKLFEDYGGFDGKNFPNYYEDTDLQMHIQHDLGKEVWFQPKSIALHNEHGSFGTEDSRKRMESASKKFVKKWGAAMREHHVDPPQLLLDKNMQEFELFRASDLRARDPKKANILYLDERFPNRSRGSGYGRSFDNLSMLAELGHFITLVTLSPLDKENWCDDKCIDEITQLGIEYMSTSKWDELVQSRIGYYDIVIVTRPSTFKATYEKWKDFYKQKSFSFIYDSEALWFRRDELLDEIVQSKKIDFPGYQNDLNQELTRLVTQIKRRSELSLIQMAETFIAVSKQEKKVIKMLLPHDTNVKIIGFVMDLKTMTKNAFSERNGILFLAAFHNSMYYNGDAIWYFLKFIYPRIIEATFNNRVPALTIAGRGIPDELYEFVKANKLITNYITFLESPPSIEELFETNRILIAPHLYGAGIQYKVSEALAAGLPVVMSEFTKESFGGEAPGCTGFDPESFAKCVIDVHDNQEQWEFLRSEGLSYILRTHSRKEVMKQWSEIIGSSFKDVAKKRSKKLLDVRMNLPTERCEEGEDIYLSQFEDIAIAVKEGRIGSGFEHWSEFGKYEGRNYYCRKMAF